MDKQICSLREQHSNLDTMLIALDGKLDALAARPAGGLEALDVKLDILASELVDVQQLLQPRVAGIGRTWYSSQLAGLGEWRGVGGTGAAPSPAQHVCVTDFIDTPPNVSYDAHADAREVHDDARHVPLGGDMVPAKACRSGSVEPEITGSPLSVVTPAGLH